MTTRDEFRQQAIGQFMLTNPTAKPEEWRLYADGAIMAWDWMQKKQREEAARKLTPITTLHPAGGK